MLTLVIDTASNAGTVGIVEGDTLLIERRWAVTTTYSLELLAAIEAVLAEAGVERTALEGVVVSVGPGAYGGLRAGVATAQGLALGLDVPLAGVARLEADAVPLLVSASAAPVVAVHHAGSPGVAWAVYGRGDWPAGSPSELQAARLGTTEECVLAAPEGARWCGEITPELRDAIVAGGWTESSITATMPAATDARAWPPRALDLARLARVHEAFGDAALVDVLYLRPPAISPPREDYGAHPPR